MAGISTAMGERSNQSPWMRELSPRLLDDPKLEINANGLQDYLKKDNIPRTKNTVALSISKLFETK